MQVRTTILANVTARLNGLFGTDGTSKKIFRKVKRGTWNPGATMRPMLTVEDYGGKAVTSNNSDTTKGRTLTIQLIVDIEANLGNADTQNDWTDNIALIIQALQNFHAGPGCSRMDYVNDDPFDVVMAQGATQQIWIIEFETEYFVDVPAFG